MLVIGRRNHTVYLIEFLTLFQFFGESHDIFDRSEEITTGILELIY